MIVVVPEAETAVSQFRCRLDPVAQLGVPAHVSVLLPFMPAPEIDNDVVARLAALFRAAPAFKYYFVRTDGSAMRCCGWLPTRARSSDH